MYVGYEDGGFNYVMRVNTVAGDQFMFKTIQAQRRARAVTVTWRDAYYEDHRAGSRHDRRLRSAPAALVCGGDARSQ